VAVGESTVAGFEGLSYFLENQTKKKVRKIFDIFVKNGLILFDNS
jgi:hypothetical protein